MKYSFASLVSDGTGSLLSGITASFAASFHLTWLALVCFPASAQSAVTLGLWNFNNTSELNHASTSGGFGSGGYTGTTYSNAAASVPHLGVSSITAGSGLTGSTSGTISGSAVLGVGGSNPYVFSSSVAATGSPAAAITANDFFSVTLTPEDGYGLSVTEISFYAWANQTNSAGSYTYFVQSSATGGTILGTFTKAYNAAGAIVDNSMAPSSANNLYTFDLSPHAELTNSSVPVTFYIGVHSTTNGSLRLDSVQILGNVVPEPSRVLFMGLALTCCLFRRRRFSGALP